VVIDSAEAEKLMREGNLRPASSSGYQSIRNLEATKLTDPAHRSPGPNWFEQTCQLVPAMHYHLTGDHFHSAYQADHFTVLDEFCRQSIGFFRLGVVLKYAHRRPRQCSNSLKTPAFVR
jgi:hypothetical protein